MTFLLRVALASREQLGFDPSIRRIEYAREEYGPSPSIYDIYDIEVPDDSDSDADADIGTGR